MNNERSIAIVGAGAAGLAAAVEALKTAAKAHSKINVLLFDRMSRVGKKILATGNGRCNLSNTDLSPENYFGDRNLAEAVLARFDGVGTSAFFSSLGLFTKTDFAGRVYPLSGQASAVLDILRFACENLGAEIKTDTTVDRIRESGNGYIINDGIYIDRVIIASGGCAQSVHGSDGSGYELLKTLGTELKPVFPSLTPIIIKDFTKALKGIRADGRITVKRTGKVLASDCGEIQYTDYGLSGIPALQVSRCVSEHFALNIAGELLIYVDRAPTLTEDELAGYIRDSKKSRDYLTCADLLTGIMPKRLGVTVLAESAINPEKSLRTINDGVIPVLVKNIKSKKYTPTGVLGFADAQVTSGGVAGAEIEYSDMSLKKHRGVYVCGEVVDVDGRCGGYNLQWAWSSGRLAGMSAVESLL